MEEQLMTILILTACRLSCTESHSTTYFFPHCSYNTYDLDEFKIAYMTYAGGNVSTFCDQMAFHVHGYGHLNTYKMCIAPIDFKDPNCSMKLEYKEDFRAASPLRTFSCSNIPTKEFCTGDGSNAEFNLKINTSRSHSNALFRFRIRVVVTLNYGALIGDVIEGVCTGIALICLLVGISVCLQYKRERPVRTVVSTMGTVGVTQYNTAGSYLQPLTGSYPRQTSGMNYPQQYTAVYSPYHFQGAYPSTQFQQATSSMAPNPQFQEPVTETTAPPPPYEEVTSQK